MNSNIKKNDLSVRNINCKYCIKLLMNVKNIVQEKTVIFPIDILGTLKIYTVVQMNLLNIVPAICLLGSNFWRIQAKQC